MAAEDLQALRGGDPAVVGEEGLDHRRQQRDQVAGFLALVGIVRGVLLVEQQRAVHRQRAAAFGIGARGEQHLAHVGVHDDRVGRTLRRLRAGQRAHLQAVLRVGHRVLVGHLGQPQALVAHAQARGVHHHEHRRQALVRLPDQRADGAVQVDLAGGAAVDAHLVFERAAIDRIALAELAIGTDLVLRHDEQRDALVALGCIGQARQHQMQDVVGQVVLAGGDEDLLPGELVAGRRRWVRPWCGSGPGRCRTAARSGTSCRPSRPWPGAAGTAPSARRCHARAARRRHRATARGTSSRPGWPSSASRRSTGSAAPAGPGRRRPGRTPSTASRLRRRWHRPP